MNFIKRAFLSVKARKGKSLLQLFVFSVICVLVLSGLSIQSAADKATDLARQQLGASVTLQADMQKLREEQKSLMEAGERPSFNQPPIEAETAEELTSYSNIKGYNFYSSTTGTASDFEPVESSSSSDSSQSVMEFPPGGQGMGGGGMAQGDVSLSGVLFTDSTEDFMDETATILEGRHLTDEDLGSQVAVIEETLAEQNGVSVGDSITVASPSDEETTVTLEIVGIYQTTSTGNQMGMSFTALNPYNTLYVPYTVATDFKGTDYEGTIDSAVYYLDDPENMEAFIEEAEKNSSIDFDTFTLNANDQMYEQMMGSIENVGSFSKNVVLLVSITGAIILALIVMMSIRERKYEMGVLLALGEKRWKLVGQFVTEILIVAVLSIGIAAVCGNLTADKIGDQLLAQQTETAQSAPQSFNGPAPMDFGDRGPGMNGGMQPQAAETSTENDLDVQVTAGDLGLLSVIGLLIGFVAALIPSLSVLRLQPKTILSRQD